MWAQLAQPDSFISIEIPKSCWVGYDGGSGPENHDRKGTNLCETPRLTPAISPSVSCRFLFFEQYPASVESALCHWNNNGRSRLGESFIELFWIICLFNGLIKSVHSTRFWNIEFYREAIKIIAFLSFFLEHLFYSSFSVPLTRQLQDTYESFRVPSGSYCYSWS